MAAAERAPPPGAGPAGAGWQWRTFPVFFAFVAGVFVMAVIAQLSLGLFVILYFAAGVGVAFGLAHTLTRWFVARRRR